MAEMSASEARAEWARVLRTVRNGEPVTVTQHGEPAAVVIDIAMWNRIQVTLGDWHDAAQGDAAMRRIESGEEAVLPLEQLAPKLAEMVTPAVVAQVRAELGLSENSNLGTSAS